MANRVHRLKDVDHEERILRTFKVFVLAVDVVLKYANAHFYRKEGLSVIKVIVLRVLRALSHKAPAVLFRGHIAKKALDVPLVNHAGILGPVFPISIPENAFEVLGVILDGAAAFPFSLLGEHESLHQGFEGCPRRFQFG